MDQIDYNLVQGKNTGEKSRWHKIGEARKHATGFWLRMDVMPIPNEDGQIWLQLYERMEDDEIQKKNGKDQKQKAVYEKSYGGTAK